MDTAAIGVGVVGLIGNAALALVGWSLKRNADEVSDRLRRLEEAPHFDPEKCQMRHADVDREIERRSRSHHELANEMQAVKLMLSRLDKRLAVFMAAIAKDKGLDIPEDE